MNYRRTIHILLLLSAMQATSAYKQRCWFLCKEQTAIQNDYVSDRDRCRNYSQLRIDTDTSSPELLESGPRKAKLISLFSACMSEKGWTVPDGKYSQQASAPTPVPNPATPGLTFVPTKAASTAAAPIAASAAVAATAPSAAAMATQQRNRAFLARSTECAFSRHSSGQSAAASARAQACDIECAERLKASPDAPRPAACPADVNTNSR